MKVSGIYQPTKRKQFFTLLLLLLLAHCSIRAQIRIGDFPLSRIDSLTLELAKPKISDPEKCDLLTELAKEYFNAEIYDRSLASADSALVIATALGDLKRQARALAGKGVVDVMLGRYESSIDAYLDALRKYEEIEDELGVARTFLSLGAVYGAVNNQELSLKYLGKGLQFTDILDSLSISGGHSNTGLVYEEMRQYDQALYHYDKALDFAPHDDDYGRGTVENNIGVMMYDQGSVEKAIEHYKKAIEYFLKAENIGGMANSQNNLAEVYIELGDFETANNWVSRGLENSKKVGEPLLVADSYRLLSQVLAQDGEFEEALEFLRMSTAIKDSINDPRTTSKVTLLAQAYEKEKLERERALEIELIEQKQTLANYRWILITASLMIVALIFLFLTFRHRTRKRLVEIDLSNARLKEKQLEDELEFKNNELTNFATYILKKNEFLSDLKLVLEKMKNQEDVGDLASSIKDHLHLDKDRKDLEIRIHQVNESFFFKLDKRFPDLTKRERQLASLLMLRFSSKEIASLMNITVGSVEKARHRLRKKMELDAETSLTTFLNHL